MEWVTTSTILERLRDFDDQSVWQTFVKRFRRPIVSFARKCGLSTAEAQDAAQDILIAFAESFRNGRYDPARGRLSSWLFGIAYRHIAGARRQRIRGERKLDARGRHTSFWAELPGEREASVAWDAEWDEARIEVCLRQAKREVAPHTFQAFELVVRKGRSPDQAAAELGITRDAVYVAKHRVLKRLRELAAAFDELPQES